MSNQILFQLINPPKRGKDLLIALAKKNPDITFTNVMNYVKDTNFSPNQFITTCNTAIIITNYWNSCQSVVKARISNRLNHNPYMRTLLFIGDVLKCKDGFIEVNNWEDISTFSDAKTLYILKCEEEDMVYRTEQLILNPIIQSRLNQHNTFSTGYQSIEDEVLTSSNELVDYDIELSAQTVAYLKKHVWTNGDKETEFAYPRETICHTEERLAYKKQTVMYDILLAWLSLQYYKSVGIEPLHRVYTNGVDMFVPTETDDLDRLISTPILTYVS